MVANTIDDVRRAFADKTLAANFATGFIEAYAGAAFGVLPKGEIDLLVFSLLIHAGVIDANASLYRIARALNVTPAKARNLLFQHQLRHVSETETDHAVMIALTTARYRKEGANLSFGVASPLVQAAIRARMQDGGVFADVSLSGDILRVSPEQFGAVIGSLISDAEARRLIAHLKSKKLVDESALRKAVGDLGSGLAKKVVEAGGDKALDPLLEGLGRFLIEKGPEAMDVLGGLLT
jgi:hypothetical protein